MACVTVNHGDHGSDYNCNIMGDLFIMDASVQTTSRIYGTYSIHVTHSSRPFKLLRGVTYITLKICRTIVLPVVSYGCENLSLTFREEHRPRKFENRVLRRIFGHKRHKVTEEWRRLCNSLEQRSSREAKRSQLVRKFSEFKGNPRFITARTAIFCAITQVVSFLQVFPRKSCMHFSFHL